MRDNQRNFEEREYLSILTQMTSWTHQTTYVDGEIKTGSGTVAEPKVEYISKLTIQVDFGKPWLASEADVEEYLKYLKAAFLDEIKQGKRIKL